MQPSNLKGDVDTIRPCDLSNDLESDMWKANLDSVRRVLCLGAHSDDIEIGLGGRLLKLAERRSDLEILWVVFSAPGVRAEEARESAYEFLSCVERKQVKIGLECIRTHRTQRS